LKVYCYLDSWLLKEAIFVKRENPSLNRNGGLRFNLAKIYDSILTPWSRSIDQSNANEVISSEEGATASYQDNNRPLATGETR
ncbi:MAG: hypothetical protein ACRCUD_04255, partial [Cetobacterium sp.]